MRIFKIADVEMIEEMLANGKTVEVEWLKAYERKITTTDVVKWVRWDGLVFTTHDAIFPGSDKLVSIKEI